MPVVVPHITHDPPKHDPPYEPPTDPEWLRGVLEGGGTISWEMAQKLGLTENRP